MSKRTRLSSVIRRESKWSAGLLTLTILHAATRVSLTLLLPRTPTSLEHPDRVKMLLRATSQGSTTISPTYRIQTTFKSSPRARSSSTTPRWTTAKWVKARRATRQKRAKNQASKMRMQLWDTFCNRAWTLLSFRWTSPRFKLTRVLSMTSSWPIEVNMPWERSSLMSRPNQFWRPREN